MYPSKCSETDVPQPGQVLTVRHLAVDRNDHSRSGFSTIDSASCQPAGFGPAADVRCASRSAPSDSGPPPRRPPTPPPPPRPDRRPSPPQPRRPARHFHGSPHRAAPGAWGGETVWGHKASRRRTTTGAGRAKIVPVECQSAPSRTMTSPATRAAHRVVGPTAAGRDPHHVRAVVGRRGHQHVIAIGDDDGIRMTGQAGTQRPFDVVDLTHPVQLVAGDSAARSPPGSPRRRRADVHLVDLEGGQAGVPVGGQCGHQTRVHVGALSVGRHRLMSAAWRLPV